MKKVMFLMALTMTGVCLFAQEKRLYVNLETVFEGFYKTIAANISFENRKQEVEDQIELIRKEMDTLNADAKKCDAEMRNELLSKEAREKAARMLQAQVERLRAKDREFQRTKNENYQMLQKLRLEREEEIVKEILKVVDAVADEQKATEVIEISGKTFNRVTVFLRYPKDKEITEEVLKRLNVGHEEELKNAKEELDRRRAKAAAPNAAAPAAK